MLLAYRLAGLSALETYYAGVRVGAQFGPTQRSRAAFRRFRPWEIAGASALASAASLEALAREAGAAGDGSRGNRSPDAFLRQGDGARPRRLRVHWRPSEDFIWPPQQAGPR
jgi:hypothetical protein